MQALLGGARGSARPPRLVIMRWQGGKSDDAPLAFVGKGEVFVSADKGESWQKIASGLPAIGKPTHDTLIVGMGYGSPEEALPVA